MSNNAENQDNFTPPPPDSGNNPSSSERSGLSDDSQQANPVQTDTVNWQAKYNGLQGHAKTMTKQRDDWFSKFNDVNQQLEAQKLQFEQELFDLRQSSTEAASELETLRT